MSIDKGLLKRIIWKMPHLVHDTIWRLTGWQLQAQIDIDTSEVVGLTWVPNEEIMKAEEEDDS